MKRLLIFLFSVFNFSFTQAQYILYGTTCGVGTFSKGSIFSYNPFTHIDNVLFRFNGADGWSPQGDLLLVSDSLFYGTTDLGGNNIHLGTVFKYNINTAMENVVVNFDSASGYEQNGGNNLIQAKNGLLYGTTFEGGLHNSGSLFSYNPTTGKDSVLFYFDTTTSGFGPYKALYQDTTTGLLYGTTEIGGTYGWGVLYCFNPVTNKDTVLVNFPGLPLVGHPSSGLTKASNGLLYGMSVNCGDSNMGNIYSYNLTSNALKIEYSFHTSQGIYPNGSNLIQLPSGLMYGMTSHGGSGFGSAGVLFSFDPVTDSEKVLVNFNENNGAFPYQTVTFDPDNGLLYGMTYMGGSADEGVFFSYDISTSTYTKIFDFTGPNGAYPAGELTLVKDTSIFTGVGKINVGGGVRVYPNPSDGKFVIQIVNGKLLMVNEMQVEVYNVLGQRVYSTPNLLPPAGGSVSFTFQMNLSAQPNGVYFYRVVGKDGELVGEGKVVIQK